MFSIRLCFFGATLLLLFSFSQGSFKDEQLRYPRVRQAYAEKEQSVSRLLSNQGIRLETARLYLRGFKQEKTLEVWAKNITDSAYQLITVYNMCRTSGILGPKREQGDGQIPEGYYHLDLFNPASSYFLSLRVNHPNASDRILGNPRGLGGDIYLHGSCVTIGCIPITDEKIKELYLLCVEARDHGQTKIPITLFPARLDPTTYQNLVACKPTYSDAVNLWADLKLGYDYFNEHHTLPTIGFLSNGRHTVK